MTACTNKARGAVVAALAGVLALGAVPAVALATGSDVSLQWVTPTGAFENATVDVAAVRHGNQGLEVESPLNGAIQVTFVENQPVSFEYFDISMIGSAQEDDDFRVYPAWEDDEFEVAFYKRDSKGNPVGAEIENDLTEVGQYCAVITGVEGSPYDEGELVIPIDILAADFIVGIEGDTNADGSFDLYYDATVHNDDFEFTFDGDPVTEGVDYDVYYILDGHDTTEKVDVKDAAKYRAVLVGKGAYAGSTEISPIINVKPLELSDYANVHFEGLAATGDDEIENILAIWINGHRFTGDDAIMGELRADIDVEDVDGDDITSADTGDGYAGTVWKDNGKYRYNGYKADPNNGNISNDVRGFDAFKVKYLADFQYADQAWPTSGWETVLTDADTVWTSGNVTAHADNDLKGGVDLSFTDGEIEKYRIFDASGAQVDGENMAAPAYDWGHTPGTYTVTYRVTPDEMKEAGYVYGGQCVSTVTVYADAINADAKAAVLFDVDDDETNEVVTSVAVTYDPARTDLKDEIEVVVNDAAGYNLLDDGRAVVTYYDSEGRVVKGALTEAGTYTLKVTSASYKLTGTTEMTVTIGKLDLSDVKANGVKPHKWDDAGNVTEYLRWREKGVSLVGLDLVYLPSGAEDVPGNWERFPMNQVKATILDSEGNKLDKIEDEGVYTIHFEARNDDAANNYVVPADFTVTCIKDGWNKDHVNHLKFRDVAYTDYFANAVDKVSNERYMTGYKGTKLFGSYDNLNRGQMAIVLYNMAKADGKMSENGLQYTELGGYITGFEDVDGNEYYAKAIAWARLAGVVNGYDETHFGPEDTITREQFVAMMVNYEKKFGDYEQADASVLDDFSDASGVSSWATNAVAWGVENGILGNGGFLAAQSDIIRADAACMVYNYTK